ncbi:hypothetical protein BA060_12440 [Brucella sp. B13-0095]|nr:hypothetical protein BA060_12440 [Brucella sp. B13-0095]
MPSFAPTVGYAAFHHLRLATSGSKIVERLSTRHSQRRVMLITAKKRFLQAYRERTGWFTARKSIWLEMHTFPGRIIQRIEAGSEISPVD